jgi:alpha-mannosidase
LTIRQGYNLNYGLFSISAEKHAGVLPTEHSFVEIKPENVVLTAIKKAEDDDALILRFFEWAGKDTEVQIQLPPGAQSAHDANLMEHPFANLAVKNGLVAVHAKPYEIKTVKVRFDLPPISQLPGAAN